MYRKHYAGTQRGIATLGVTLLLLFIVTLVTLYTAKTSIREQQISANQYRADQSMSTGNAALDWGGAYYTAARGGYCEKDTTIEECLQVNGVCILNKTVVEIMDDLESAECSFIYNESSPLYIDPDLDPELVNNVDALSIGSSEMYYAYVDDDGNEYQHIKVEGGGLPDLYKTPVRIYGIGHSDDDTGIRTISVTAKTGNVFGDDGPGGINYPLVAKKVVSDHSGGVSVINRYENRTILSGDAQSLGGSTQTYVAKPGTNCHDWVNRSKCIYMQPELGTDVEATEDNKINSDVIDNNTNLSNKTEDEFFADLFGRTKQEMKDFIVDNGEVFPNTKAWSELLYTDKTLVDPAYEGPTLSPLVWIEGDYSPSGTSSEILGTDKNPVLLIVNGDVKFGGNINIVGILYVIGEWDPGSNSTIRGIVINEGGLHGTGGGGTTIVYDADLLNGTLGPPPGTVAASTPGSWKDWE